MLKNILIVLLSILLVILMSKDMKNSNDNKQLEKKSPKDIIQIDSEKQKMIDNLLDEESGKVDATCLKYTHFIENSFFQQAIYNGNNIYCEIKFIKDGIEKVKRIELSTIKSIIKKEEKEGI